MPHSPPFSQLSALSPLDGRYHKQLEPLRACFSEAALFRHRVAIELRWLLALAAEPAIAEIKPFSKDTSAVLESVIATFSEEDAAQVKAIEAETNHDVKAIEIWLKKRLASNPEAARVAADIGFPVLVRPSYVLGGRAMVIAYDLNTVQEYVAQAALMGPARPVLIDQFLEEATEVDVDAMADGEDVVIGGIMEHIEEAGVHSGDSSCVLPPVSLSPSVLARIRDYTKRLAKALQVVGLMNVQYAIQRDTVYVLEVNPRASRTVPYVSKATGVPLAKVAARLMAGRKLRDMNLPVVETDGVAEIAVRDYYAVKSPVFPFNKFRGVDTILGPEMRSTGEVMGVAKGFGQAFAKAQLAAGQRLPRKGAIFLSVSDHDKRHVAPLAKELHALGFRLVATRGTAAALEAAGVPAERVYKVNEGRPNIVDLVKTGKVDMVINTPLGRESFYDEKSIRRAAIRYNIPCITTLSAANAAALGIRALIEHSFDVQPLQSLHARKAAAQRSPSSAD